MKQIAKSWKVLLVTAALTLPSLAFAPPAGRGGITPRVLDIRKVMELQAKPGPVLACCLCDVRRYSARALTFQQTKQRHGRHNFRCARYR